MGGTVVTAAMSLCWVQSFHASTQDLLAVPQHMQVVPFPEGWDALMHQDL